METRRGRPVAGAFSSLGSFFAVIGGVLIAGGGIVLAIAMESVLAKESLDTDSRAGAA
jgi:hypothetical protein